MALSKTLSEENGITASYWIIDRIDISYKQKHVM